MKKLLPAILTLLSTSLLAADLSLRVVSVQMNGTNTTLIIGVSGTDTNHLYSLFHRSDILSTNLIPISTNFFGTNEEAMFQDTSTESKRFYTARREAGFIAWAEVDDTPFGGNPNDCPGPYLGRAIFFKPIPIYGWFQQTNNPPWIARDATGRTDSRIQWFTEYGEFGCDEGGKVTMPQFADLGFAPPAARFVVYWRTNLPAGPYPLHLIGFNE